MTFHDFCIEFINTLNEFDDPKIIKWNTYDGSCEFIDHMPAIDFSFHVDTHNRCEYRMWYTDEFRHKHSLTFEFKKGIAFQESILFTFLKLGCIQSFVSCLLFWAMCYCKIPIMYLIEMAVEQPDVLKVLLNTDFVKPVFDTNYFRYDPEDTFEDVVEFKDGTTIFDIDITQLKIIISRYVKNVESKAVILDYIRKHQGEKEEEIGL